MKTLIEQISLWGAIVGSLLLALNIPVSGWAYIPFLLSNLATLYLLKNVNQVPKVLTWQIVFFIIINLIGIGRWLL
jgi:hypothetical protein